MRWPLLVALFAVACASPTPPAEPTPPVERPNVLVLLADDLRRDALGAFGSTRGTTPHLDALADRGLACERAYCMGSRHGAVCVPARAMLLSGRGLLRAPDDLAGCRTLPEHLRAAGYTTWMTGKWHNGDAALVRAFPDATSVFRGGMHDHFRVPVADVVAGAIGAPRTDARHASEQFADAAIAFLQQRAVDRATSTPGGEAPPFLAYVAFMAPHDPRDAPLAWRERAAANPPPLPPNFRGQHGLDLGGETMSVRDEQLLPWPRPPELLRQQLAEYEALVAHLDAQIGRILAALAATGLDRSTLVVFASDHGLALGSHGLLGKQSLYEHSMGTPLLFAGPGVARGRSAALVHLSDVAPTLCAAAGAPAMPGTDGADLWPLLRGAGAPPRDHVFTLYADSQRSVRDEQWRLIRLPQIDRTLLFDLAADPHELHDLAGDPAHAATRTRLEQTLRDAQAAAGDTLPWTATTVRPATIDLAGRARTPDRWQPAWIRAKYFD